MTRPICGSERVVPATRPDDPETYDFLSVPRPVSETRGAGAAPSACAAPEEADHD